MDSSNPGDAPREARFRTFVQELLAQHIKPTPGEIFKRQGREHFASKGSGLGGCLLNGSLSKVRREELHNAGWRQDEEGGKWQPPASW